MFINTVNIKTIERTQRHMQVQML